MRTPGLPAVLPSAAWRLVEALGTLRDTDGRVTVDVLRRRCGHRPRRNCEAVDGISAQTRTRAGEPPTGSRHFIADLQGQELGRRIAFSPSLNIAGLHTGYSGPGMKTVLPAQASAWLDFRLVPEQQPDQALEATPAPSRPPRLRRHRRSPPSPRQIRRRRRSTTPSSPLCRRRRSRPRQTRMDRPIVAGSLPFIASLQRHIGIPGLSVCDNASYYGCAAHAPNENIRLADIKPAAQYFFALLAELGSESPLTGRRYRGRVSASCAPWRWGCSPGPVFRNDARGRPTQGYAFDRFRPE